MHSSLCTLVRCSCISSWCPARTDGVAMVLQKRGAVQGGCREVGQTRALPRWGDSAAGWLLGASSTLCAAMPPHQLPDIGHGLGRRQLEAELENRDAAPLHGWDHQRLSALITNGSCTTKQRNTFQLCNGGSRKPCKAQSVCFVWCPALLAVTGIPAPLPRPFLPWIWLLLRS